MAKKKKAGARGTGFIIAAGTTNIFMKRVYRRVVLVDDEAIQNKIHTTLIQRYLGNYSIEIVSFTNPEQALRYLADENAKGISTLVLLDLRMPSVDGWEFLNRLQPAELNDTIIYMLSSSTIQADIDKANSHPRLAGYTRKPLSSALNGLLVATLMALENGDARG